MPPSEHTHTYTHARTHKLESRRCSVEYVCTFYVLQVFFATIGASTDVKALAASGAILPMLSFIAVLLLVHAFILEVLGRRLLKLFPKDLLLASNAAVGGDIIMCV
jgi:sodium--glutamate symport carrier gltS